MASCPIRLTKAIAPQSRARGDGQPRRDVDPATHANNETQHVRGHRTQSAKYHNEDLPGFPQSLKSFRDHVLPRWYLYVATLDDPWDLQHPDHVVFAQQLWSRYVPVKHQLGIRNEPVFAIVSKDSCFVMILTMAVKMKQRACEWRGEIAKKALLAVEHFFGQHTELESPEGRAAYVAWAVPENQFIVDRGQKTIIPPGIYPYMWEDVGESEAGDLVRLGASLKHMYLYFIDYKRCLSAPLYHSNLRLFDDHYS